jgi:hypothetical protein
MDSNLSQNNRVPHLHILYLEHTFWNYASIWALVSQVTPFSRCFVTYVLRIHKPEVNNFVDISFLIALNLPHSPDGKLSLTPIQHKSKTVVLYVLNLVRFTSDRPSSIHDIEIWSHIHAAWRAYDYTARQTSILACIKVTVFLWYFDLYPMN